jgi:nickel-dependent lactate racemase
MPEETFVEFAERMKGEPLTFYQQEIAKYIAEENRSYRVIHHSVERRQGKSLSEKILRDKINECVEKSRQAMLAGQHMQIIIDDAPNIKTFDTQKDKAHDAED